MSFKCNTCTPSVKATFQGVCCNNWCTNCSFCFFLCCITCVSNEIWAICNKEVVCLCAVAIVKENVYGFGWNVNCEPTCIAFYCCQSCSSPCTKRFRLPCVSINCGPCCCIEIKCCLYFRNTHCSFSFFLGCITCVLVEIWTICNYKVSCLISSVIENNVLCISRNLNTVPTFFACYCIDCCSWPST